jgi:glycosyltransferase involved in cell wall biosynthesis
MILVLSDLWPPFPGGAERLMFNLARDLHQRGEDVHVLTGYENARQFDGPPVTRYPIGVLDTKDEGWAIVHEFVQADQPSLVLTSHLYASQFGAELVAMGLPLVHVVLNGPRVPGCAAAVYITEWVKARYDGRPDDLVVIPPAFPDVVADTHGDAIGFVKPIEHKGVETLYALAERLPHREFVVLRGEWQDIELIRDDLANVRFMEPVVDIAEFYSQVRLMLMPSRSEDAGTVAQEATLNGIPCISSNVDGLNETNGGGIRLAPTDVPAWADTIERLLTDPELYAGVVASQQRHLHTSTMGQLDAFADLIAKLNGSR